VECKYWLLIGHSCVHDCVLEGDELQFKTWFDIFIFLTVRLTNIVICKCDVNKQLQADSVISNVLFNLKSLACANCQQQKLAVDLRQYKNQLYYQTTTYNGPHCRATHFRCQLTLNVSSVCLSSRPESSQLY
jgi:hypothetical protein